MKKNLLLLVLALIGMGGFTACNNDDELLVQEQTETKPVVIRATIGNVSRLALGDSEGGQTKLSWGTGDAFALTIGGNSYTFEWVSGNELPVPLPLLIRLLQQMNLLHKAVRKMM